MKKLFIAASLIIGMIAGAMVLCSFTTMKESENVSEVNCNVADEEWSYYTKVSVHGYYKSSMSKNWENLGNGNHNYYSNCEVQRRNWCGEKEYRIMINGTWYNVVTHDCPVSQYNYYAWVGTYIYCFNM